MAGEWSCCRTIYFYTFNIELDLASVADALRRAGRVSDLQIPPRNIARLLERTIPMKTRIPVLLSLALMVAALPLGESARAQEASQEGTEQALHVLAGHPFLPSYLIPSAFSDSRAELGLGFAYASYDVTLLAREREVKLAAVGPQARVQVRVFSRLSLDLGARVNAVAPMNTAAIADYGASTTLDVQAGALFEVIRARRNVLSVGFSVVAPKHYAVSPVDALQEVVAGQGDPSFVSNRVSTRFIPDLRWAHAFAPAIGIQSQLGFVLDDTERNGEEQDLSTRLNLAFGVSTDLNQWIHVPIGLTANYRRGQVISEGLTNADTLSFGLYETFKSNDFNVGFELGFASAGGTTSTIGALVFRSYYL